MSAASPLADAAVVFAGERPRLVGLAYRMLGTFADAEDVVQDAWLRWDAADRASIDRPAAWLTTVTTRLALDRLRSVKRRREEYVGPWLPEPLVASVEPAPEAAAELADSLTLGFLTLIDRLGPVERAVFLLADVFGFPYADVAETVGKSEAACRQIASRARRRVQGADSRRSDDTHEREVVAGLVAAIVSGNVEGVLALVAPDVVLVSDGGPNRHAARRPVVGADRVSRFLTNLSKRMGASAEVAPAKVNGDPGLVLRVAGEVELVIAFEVHDRQVAAIWIVNNPDKLEHVGAPLAIA